VHNRIRSQGAATVEDLVVSVKNRPVIKVGVPGQVIGADEQKDGAGLGAQDVIQALQNAARVIRVDAAILERHAREQLLPAATVGDTVPQKDNVALLHRVTLKEIRPLQIMVGFNAFHSHAAKR